MSGETLIRCENVSKRFCKDLKKSLWYGFTDIALDTFPFLVSSKSGSLGTVEDRNLRDGEFWAVKDVSFEVKRGECFGLIGGNGAGKTTLLKMISGLITPDSGSIEISGKVGGLIALSAGFNPILTGRENVFVNGSILGLSRKEILRNYDRIVDFAELEGFMDMPVRNYSSGMAVRLGFAIAALLTKPDVFLLDEVLAVGDAGFANKCFNLVMSSAEERATVFVSHSMPLIARIATKGIVMRKGTVVYESEDKGELVNAYNMEFPFESGAVCEGVIGFRLLNTSTRGFVEKDGSLPLLQQGNDLTLEFELENSSSFESGNLLCNVIIYTQSMVAAAASDKFEFPTVSGKFSVTVTFPELNLASGIYSFSVGFNHRSEPTATPYILATYGTYLPFMVAGHRETVDATGALTYAKDQWELLT